MTTKKKGLLCKLGFHRFEKYGTQTYCLNNPSSGPLEFNTLIWFRCRCGLERNKWREDHYLNNDRRVMPWEGIRLIKQEQK